MPLFLVERQYADEVEISDRDRRGARAYEAQAEIRWITSFLSADRKKTYCLYEVEDADRLRRHATDLGIPADAIVEVTEMPG